MTSGALRPRQSPAAGAPAPSARAFPESDNPLTLALIQSTRATTHADIIQAARLIRALESQLTGCEVYRCRLAAEVLIERRQA